MRNRLNRLQKQIMLNWIELRPHLVASQDLRLGPAAFQNLGLDLDQPGGLLTTGLGRPLCADADEASRPGLARPGR